MKQEAIDLVYTWVNGHDPDHQKISQQYATIKRDLNPERTRDEYTLLKYSLRSVELYAPWVRNIYILTMRPQVPDWLNTAHPRIHVVHHDEIIDEQYLPTFNSHCIESFLSRIPGVSDYFLYLNDDHLFGRTTDQATFLDKANKIQLYSTVMGEPIPFIYDNKINGLVSPLQHIPFLVYKPYWEDMLHIWANKIHKTRISKFRNPWCLDMGCLYRYYLVTRQRKQIQVIPAFRYLKYHVFLKVTNHLKKQEAGINKIRTMRPKFYCLNDDQGNVPSQEVVALVQNFLNETYPHPSPYEA